MLNGILKLLHPFMPFITEEIFSSLPHLPGDAESIMISRYPTGRSDLEFPVEAGEMERVLELIDGELSEPVTFKRYPRSAEYLLNLRRRVNEEIVRARG